jgi:hypothetical protein
MLRDNVVERLNDTDAVLRVCGTCAAFRVNASNVQQGQCHHGPPVPMFLGLKPGPGGQPMPIIQSVWPPVGAKDGCRQWVGRK